MMAARESKSFNFHGACQHVVGDKIKGIAYTRDMRAWSVFCRRAKLSWITWVN